MKNLSLAQLDEKLSANTAKILELTAGDTTDEQLAEALELDKENVEINEAKAAIEARAEKAASLRDQYASAPSDEDEDEEPAEETASDEGDEPEGDDDAEDEGDDEGDEGDDAGDAVETAKTVVASSRRAPAKSSARSQVGRKTKAKTPAPVEEKQRISITAGADIDGFSTGSTIDGTRGVAKALAVRTKGFPKFNASRAKSIAAQSDGEQRLHKFGLATIDIPFDADITVTEGDSGDAILSKSLRAASLERLPEKSLLAAGWCAPSKPVYDLCEGETLDGIADVPEMGVDRGGVLHTSGPTFADFYETGFFQTEAQAIAGEEKDCNQVECPPFVDIRLNAIGLCITTPILTEAAYPELTRRFVEGSLVGHAHRINQFVLNSIENGSTAQAISPGNLAFGSSAGDTFAALGIIAAARREKFRLGLNAPMEVILPHWVHEVIREDLARRNSVSIGQVTDAAIATEFRERKLAVQWVYDWAGIGAVATDGTPSYPTNFKALMYPAGTWTKGTAPVINLSAVYDAASLKVNTYTGLFMEQGILMMKNCFDSDVVTIPVCSAGRTGASNFTCA